MHEVGERPGEMVVEYVRFFDFASYQPKRIARHATGSDLNVVGRANHAYAVVIKLSRFGGLGERKNRCLNSKFTCVDANLPNELFQSTLCVREERSINV